MQSKAKAIDENCFDHSRPKEKGSALPPAGRSPTGWEGGRRAELGEALFFGDFGAAEAGAAPFGRRNGSAKVNAPCAISAPATRSFLLPAMQHGERPKKVGSGHSAKGLSRYVVVNAKVFLDSADAPQEVIDFFPRNPQGLPLRFLREPRLFENGGEAEGRAKMRVPDTIAIELEEAGDSRSTFRLRLDSTVVGENLTAAQAQLLVGDILERIALPNRDRIGREIGAAEGELEPREGQMFRVATMTTAWRVRLAAMSATLRQSARSRFLKPMQPEW